MRANRVQRIGTVGMLSESVSQVVCIFTHSILFHKLFTVFLILTLSLCIGCVNLSTVGSSLLEATSNVNIFTDEEEIQIGRGVRGRA